MSELKPCPFCGSKEIKETGCDWAYTVTCWDCEFDGPERQTREQANEAWNQRHD